MGWGREEAECVPLTTPGAAEQAEKPMEDHFPSWELHSAQLIFPIPVSPSSFKARFCGFHKFPG